MQDVPVVTRTQRRLERRQVMVMTILVGAVTVASFFLGVMVGERSAASRVDELTQQMAVQVTPPLTAPVVAPKKLTFYDDLPKGNAAPLGSGINLPKGGLVTPPPASAAAVPTAPPATAAPVATAPPAKPAPVADTAQPKTVAGGKYVVQIAATKDQAEVKRLIEKLRQKGFAARSERADLGKKGIWYRVISGPYADQAAADQMAGQLQQQKFAAIVRKL